MTATQAFDAENQADPQAAEERCLLGTMLVDEQSSQCFADARELGLLPEMLASPRAAVLAAAFENFTTSLDLALRLEPPARVEVFRCIREASVPGALFRARCKGVIKRHAIAAARSGSHGVSATRWQDVGAMRAAVGEDVLAHLESASAIDAMTTDDSVAAALDEAKMTSAEVCRLPELPAFTGFCRGRLVVLGARPKVGKSLLGLQIAACAAREGWVLLASLEMSRGEQGDRLVRQVGEVDARALMLDVVDHGKAPTIEALHRLARHKKLRHGDLAMAIVDYAQICRCEGEGKMRDHERVATISRECKLMAASLNCCVVLLSQLKQASEQRDFPRASDLAQSDALQRDANHVLLLHRPHMFGNSAKRNDAVLLHDISRHGGTGMFHLLLDEDSLRFEMKPSEGSGTPRHTGWN